MTNTNSTGATPSMSTISQLQGDAWAAWNASYYAEDKDLYQTVSMSLYNQDVHERILELFARSDAQNAQIDAVLASHTS